MPASAIPSKTTLLHKGAGIDAQRTTHRRPGSWTNAPSIGVAGFERLPVIRAGWSALNVPRLDELEIHI
jgi:hypothetical protein